MELKKINLRVTKSAAQEHCKKFQLYWRTDLKNLSQTDEDQIDDQRKIGGVGGSMI